MLEGEFPPDEGEALKLLEPRALDPGDVKTWLE